MKYRAVVAFKPAKGMSEVNNAYRGNADASRIRLYSKTIQDILYYFSYAKRVEAYPDYGCNPDDEYHRVFRLLTHMSKKRRGVDIYDAKAVLNKYASLNGRFFVSKPLMVTDKRVPGERTGLLAYTRLNPFAVVESYNFPPKMNVDGCPSLEQSFMFNNLMCGYSVISPFSQVEFDDTMYEVPSVVFTFTGDPLNVASDATDPATGELFSMFESDESVEIGRFITDTVGSNAIVALVEIDC